MQTVINKVNILGGVVVTILAAIFGDHWILFAGFLLLNLVDWITGCYRSYLLGQSSSAAGAKGIAKKVMYWFVIFAAFAIAILFAEIGKTIGIDLSFAVYFGWLTLATYIINEFRSIFENLIEAGVYVPQFLVKGLEIAQNLIKTKEGDEEHEN